MTSKFASRLPTTASFCHVTLSGLPSELYRAESICKSWVGIVTCDGVDSNFRVGDQELSAFGLRYAAINPRVL